MLVLQRCLLGKSGLQAQQGHLFKCEECGHRAKDLFSLHAARRYGVKNLFLVVTKRLLFQVSICPRRAKSQLCDWCGLMTVRALPLQSFVGLHRRG